MTPRTFVGALYVFAAACLLIAVGDGSFGWFIGAGVSFAIAQYARRQWNRERAGEPVRSRGYLVGGLFIFMLLAIYGMYLLDTAA
jgi:hypothetical protein